MGVVPLPGLWGEELQAAGGDQGDGGHNEDCWNWPGERGDQENGEGVGRREERVREGWKSSRRVGFVYKEGVLGVTSYSYTYMYVHLHQHVLYMSHPSPYTCTAVYTHIIPPHTYMYMYIVHTCIGASTGGSAPAHWTTVPHTPLPSTTATPQR